MIQNKDKVSKEALTSCKGKKINPQEEKRNQYFFCPSKTIHTTDCLSISKEIMVLFLIFPETFLLRRETDRYTAAEESFPGGVLIHTALRLKPENFLSRE